MRIKPLGLHESTLDALRRDLAEQRARRLNADERIAYIVREIAFIRAADYKRIK